MRTLGILLLSLIPCLAHADPDPSMMAKLQALYPKTKFSQANTTVLTGITEVVMGQNIAYVDDGGRYFLFGRLYDMQTQQDLTQARIEDIQKIDMGRIDKSLAVKIVRGEGKRNLYLFSDPDCPYCKQLERSLATLDDVTIHIFMMPLETIHPKAREKSIAVWCAQDKAAAWLNAVANSKQIDSVTCDNPIDKIQDLAASLGINGTPTMLTDDGRKLTGARDTAAINAWLGQSSKSKTVSVKE